MTRLSEWACTCLIARYKVLLYIFVLPLFINIYCLRSFYYINFGQIYIPFSQTTVKMLWIFFTKVFFSWRFIAYWGIYREYSIKVMPCFRIRCGWFLDQGEAATPDHPGRQDWLEAGWPPHLPSLDRTQDWHRLPCRTDFHSSQTLRTVGPTDSAKRIEGVSIWNWCRSDCASQTLIILTWNMR